MAVTCGQPRRDPVPIRYQSLARPDLRMALPVLPLKPPRVTTAAQRDLLKAWHAHDGTVTCQSSSTTPCEVWDLRPVWVNPDKKAKKRRKK